MSGTHLTLFSVTDAEEDQMFQLILTVDGGEARRKFEIPRTLVHQIAKELVAAGHLMSALAMEQSPDPAK